MKGESVINLESHQYKIISNNETEELHNKSAERFEKNLIMILMIAMQRNTAIGVLNTTLE